MSDGSDRAIVNALTIDVEDYFQVSAFATHIARDTWESQPCRVEANIDRILQLLADADVQATFFTLGWIAERFPVLVRRIVDQGHELASHGYAHLRASDQGRTAFLADIRLAKAVLEGLTGQCVKGYRAPSFSVGPGNPWAFECIADAGYRYSSSIYPIRHDHYGAPDSPRFAHEVLPGLLEVPVATVRMLNANWPAGGGGYFRLLPYSVSSWSLRRVNRVDRQPAMFYFHPWELDPDQPRVKGLRAKTRFRHYVNLRRMDPRLRRLLADFRWGRVDRIFLSGDD
jgi:polysaccharide deacetylase family protein (PEP-CTERM system associated)